MGNNQDRTSISESTTAQAPSPGGEGWGEVEDAAPPPKLVPDAPEKHRLEVVIAGSMRGRIGGNCDLVRILG